MLRSLIHKVNGFVLCDISIFNRRTRKQPRARRRILSLPVLAKISGKNIHNLANNRNGIWANDQVGVQTKFRPLTKPKQTLGLKLKCSGSPDR